MTDSSSFRRRIYTEVEEAGWEHLVRSNEGLTLLSFRVLDAHGRIHVLEVHLDKEYPMRPPSVSADVPSLPKLEWNATSKLKDAVFQFRKVACVSPFILLFYSKSQGYSHDFAQYYFYIFNLPSPCAHVTMNLLFDHSLLLYCTQHLDKLENFWSVLDEIDRSLCISYPKLPCRAACSRGIDVGNDCCIMVRICVKEPRSLPECRFIGFRDNTMHLRKAWMRNSKKWNREKSFGENLESVLGFPLPKPLNQENDNQQTECGICYSQYLPIEEELGPSSGSGTDYTCENASCRRAFHSVCLIDWLRSITTTRQSFDVLFGKCPYCSEAIAVKLHKS